MSTNQNPNPMSRLRTPATWVLAVAQLVAVAGFLICTAIGTSIALEDAPTRAVYLLATGLIFALAILALRRAIDATMPQPPPEPTPDPLYRGGYLVHVWEPRCADWLDWDGLIHPDKADGLAAYRAATEDGSTAVLLECRPVLGAGAAVAVTDAD